MEFRRALRRGRKNRPRLLNRSRFTGDELYNCNTVSEMLPERLRWEGGGFVFLEGGSRKGGFVRTPRTPPPGYGPGPPVSLPALIFLLSPNIKISMFYHQI